MTMMTTTTMMMTTTIFRGRRPEPGRVCMRPRPGRLTARACSRPPGGRCFRSEGAHIPRPACRQSKAAALGGWPARRGGRCFRPPGLPGDPRPVRRQSKATALARSRSPDGRRRGACWLALCPRLLGGWLAAAGGQDLFEYTLCSRSLPGGRTSSSTCTAGRTCSSARAWGWAGSLTVPAYGRRGAGLLRVHVPGAGPAH